MQTYDTRFQAEFAAAVEARVKDVSEMVASGTLEDIAAYKHHTGRIAGLRELADLMAETSKKLKER